MKEEDEEINKSCQGLDESENKEEDEKENDGEEILEQDDLKVEDMDDDIKPVVKYDVDSASAVTYITDASSLV